MTSKKLTNGKHLVTPEIATELLTNLDNSNNREIKSSNLDNITADMLSGNWHYNGDPIRITTSGKLVDGQHRLKAIVASDKSYDMYFIVDLEDEVAEGVSIFEVIDQATRSPYEVLKIAHSELKHPREVVGLMKRVSLFNDTNALAPLPRLNNKEILEFAEHHQPLKRLDDAVDRGLNLAMRGEKILDKSDASFLSITLGSCNRGNEFLESLAPMTLGQGCVYSGQGHEVALTDPVANLAVILKGMKTSNIKKANQLKDKLLQIFKAYDLFIQDKEVKVGYIYTGKVMPYPKDYEFYTLGE